jgi:arginase
MLNRKNIYVLGYASSLAGPDPLAGEGPLVLQKSPYLISLKKTGMNLHWQTMIKSEPNNNTKLKNITDYNQILANAVADLAFNKKFFMVLGGDHSCAIGTWSGAFYAIEKQGPLGLIWIDAHMDCHTPETSLTGNYHGMPLACLLGLGNSNLTNIMTNGAKIQPEHLCLIGIRSFESDEEKLLKKLNVKIYYMDEVEKRGLKVIMQEALTIVTKGTAGFGVSLDIDSIDPIDAPATDVSEPGGIRAKELCCALELVACDPHLLGIEITEFDPHRDIDQKTEKLIPELITTMTGFIS